ncbi:MAG: hypothetical protein KA223_02545 [Candidatus Accumulibacter sp.]|nr:hypothetical protein [Accumulibacter sp.]
MKAAVVVLLLLLAGCASAGRSIELTAEQAALFEQEGGCVGITRKAAREYLMLRALFEQLMQQDDEEKPQPQKGRGA